MIGDGIDTWNTSVEFGWDNLEGDANLERGTLAAKSRFKLAKSVS